MKAKDIMTDVVKTLSPETSIFDAIDILVENKISGAPVVDDDMNVLGVVSEKDLLVSLDFLGEEKAAQTPVKEFMSKDVVSFEPEVSAKHIMQELVRKNIKRVPIVSEKKLIGIVSRRDVLRYIRRNTQK